ncbi:MAG: hypothetical protein HC773_14925 [Scytonema sp. CRU_2_7]|nr:hypothetical protein [Scytonema sp. CRU_2_7]
MVDDLINNSILRSNIFGIAIQRWLTIRNYVTESTPTRNGTTCRGLLL